jgi:hypothetical protein
LTGQQQTTAKLMIIKVGQVGYGIFSGTSTTLRDQRKGLKPMPDSPNTETNDTESHIPELSTQTSDIEAPDIVLKHLGERMRFWWNYFARHLNSNRIIAGFTVEIALTGIGYTIFAALQWSVMSGQLTELQMQTKLTRQQLVGTQAAVLKASTGFGIEGFEFGLANSRDVDAMNVSVKVMMTPVSLPGGVRLADSVVQSASAKRVTKDLGFSKRWPIPWPVQHDMQEGWPGKRTVKVEGEYSYEDGFGDTTAGTFCDVWLPVTNIVSKHENAWLGGPTQCEGIENTIRDVWERTKRGRKREEFEVISSEK